MPFPTTPLLIQPLRLYSHRAAPSRGSALGVAAVAGYCCIAFSAPFAGAAVVSSRARRDGRYAEMRPLSFRDCLRCSPLEDYAGGMRR